jgi:hypothetical protein
MKIQTSASLKFETPIIKTTADSKPKKRNISVSIVKPKKSKINKKKK